MLLSIPVRIAGLGAGVIIVPGITIGDNVVIGAGSVVTKIMLPEDVERYKNTPDKRLAQVRGA